MGAETREAFRAHLGMPSVAATCDWLEAARFDPGAFDDNRATLARRACDFLQSNGISPLAWLHGIATPPAYPPT